MAKKRRSLQSILIPPFFHPALTATSPVTSPTSQRFRSHSAAASTSHFVLPPAIPISPKSGTTSQKALGNSPPSDLLDDDPFADLSPTPSAIILPEASRASTSLSPIRPLLDVSPSTTSLALHPQTPRSPLARSFTDQENATDTDASSSTQPDTPWSSPPLTPPSDSLPMRLPRQPRGLRRPRSSGQGPAYTRPAFTPRPSLPSLHTLAQMNVVAPKVRVCYVLCRLSLMGVYACW